MNKVLIFLVLISFIICEPSKAKREEMLQEIKEHDKQLKECILRNEQTSPTLKKLIEENKEENLMKALHPRDHKLEKSDVDIIRKCRRVLIEKRKIEIRKKQKQEHREHPNNDNL